MSPPEIPGDDQSQSRRNWRQGVLDFAAAVEDDRLPPADRPPSGDEASSASSGVFGLQRVLTRLTTAPARAGDSGHARSRQLRAKTAYVVRSLFDVAPTEPEAPEPLAPEPEEGVPLEPAPFIVASGEKAKAHDIVAAIRALQQIEREQRAATSEERQTLARFAGFGPVALSIFPDPVSGRYKDASWQAIGEELKTLTTADEYESAKRTTFNAFYTSPTVIAAMHEALGRLGLPENATILEPGCGTGNFMSAGQPGLRFIGVELDSLSGRIARALHPGQDIRIESFRDTRLPEESLDGVIGNVPFADVKLEYRGQRFSLHDFFFAKSVDTLRPAGVLALVTSHFTLDKQNASIREYLASKADFVGAIRLPSDAFRRQGTSVVTDIVFLRKRALDEPPNHADPDWLATAPMTIEGADSDQPLLPRSSGNGLGRLEPQEHALRRRGLQRHGERRSGRPTP